MAFVGIDEYHQNDAELLVIVQPANAALPMSVCRDQPGNEMKNSERIPKAIAGQDRQLFLADDNNDSVGLFIEQRELGIGSFNSWRSNLSRLRELEREHGFRSAVLVAPSKEEVYSDKYPLQRAKRTVFDDFMEKFGDLVIYPKWHLKSRRMFSYTPTDTHWTDYGATVAASILLKHWEFDPDVIDKLPKDFQVIQRIGDLGNKLDPYQADYELIFSDDRSGSICFSNGMRNHGNIIVYHNETAKVKSRIAIFGDSFGTNLAVALSYVFSDVLYTYRPASFDSKINDLFNPEYVLLQITQRFVHGERSFDGSVFDTVVKKIADIPEDLRSDMIDFLSQKSKACTYTPEYPHWISLLYE